MIGEVAARVGAPVRLTGRSYDFDHAVRGVQFSLDEGATWTTHPTPGTNDYQPVDWTFSFEPQQAGTYRLLVRSVNDEGAVSPEAAYAVVRASA